jgi:hypothetical protein
MPWLASRYCSICAFCQATAVPTRFHLCVDTIFGRDNASDDRAGARFSVLDATVQQQALRELSGWATERFGSLDTVLTESFHFELIIHRFQQGTNH